MDATPQTPAREVLNTQEAASFLGIAPGTLANWRSSRSVQICHTYVGRSVRYRRSDLERFLAANVVGAVQG